MSELTRCQQENESCGYAKLEAENARLKEELESEKQYAVIVEYHEVTIRNLREQLAAAQLDAARYRWLRDECVPEKHPNHTWIVEAPGDMWDAAIDSAMKGEQS